MSADWGKQKLRRLYQDFQVPGIVIRLTTWTIELNMNISLSRELTAGRTYHLKGLRSTLRRGLASDFRGCGLFCGLTFAALAMALALVATGHRVPHLWAVLILGVIAAIAERQGVAFNETSEVSVAFLPLLFVAVAFGPLAAMIAGAMSQLGDWRRPLLRPATYVSVRAMTFAAAAAAAVVDGHQIGFAGYLLASAAASVASLAMDLAFNALILRVRRRHSVRTAVLAMAPVLLLALPLYVPLIPLFLYGYRTFSVAVVVAFCVPALALQRLIKLYQEQRSGVRDLRVANDRLAAANLSFASALVATVEARDEYTAGHSAAVAVYARDIAAQMGLSPDDQAKAHLCGLVHDVGKVGLPPGLLQKTGPLSLEERRQMERHPVIGERILEKVESYSDIARIVRHHHERVDGMGYPDRLAGDEIPLIARIIAVADAYDAMTSDRPYRDAMPSQVARLRLARAVGSQFDIAVVAAFEAILATAGSSYLASAREDIPVELRKAPEPVAVVA